MNMKTGTTIKATSYPKWAVLLADGGIEYFARSRAEAREYIQDGRLRYGHSGERLAKIETVVVEVSK